MEPSLETLQKIGGICVTWAYLEMLTERTLWGILDLNDRLAQAFVWKMQLSSRWNMIKKESRRSMSAADAETLKNFAGAVEKLARDRNIVVHGVMHAMAIIEGEKPQSGTLCGTVEDPPQFSRQPCWTIFMGEDAGKNYPISPEAVEIIAKNVAKVAAEIQAFNVAHNFTTSTTQAENVEAGWPVPL